MVSIILPAKSELCIIWSKMAAAREGVGDSSRDVLGNVRRTTKALLQAATEEEGEDSRPKELEDFIRQAL